MVFFLMPMGIRKSHHSPHNYAISDDFIYCLKLVLDKGTSLAMGLNYLIYCYLMLIFLQSHESWQFFDYVFHH